MFDVRLHFEHAEISESNRPTAGTKMCVCVWFFSVPRQFSFTFFIFFFFTLQSSFRFIRSDQILSFHFYITFSMASCDAMEKKSCIRQICTLNFLSIKALKYMLRRIQNIMKSHKHCMSREKKNKKEKKKKAMWMWCLISCGISTALFSLAFGSFSRQMKTNDWHWNTYASIHYSRTLSFVKSAK